MYTERGVHTTTHTVTKHASMTLISKSCVSVLLVWWIFAKGCLCSLALSYRSWSRFIYANEYIYTNLASSNVQRDFQHSAVHIQHWLNQISLYVRKHSISSWIHVAVPSSFPLVISTFMHVEGPSKYTPHNIMTLISRWHSTGQRHIIHRWRRIWRLCSRFVVHIIWWQIYNCENMWEHWKITLDSKTFA